MKPRRRWRPGAAEPWVKAGSWFERALVLLRKRKAMYLVSDDLLDGLVAEGNFMAGEIVRLERELAAVKNPARSAAAVQ